MGGQNSKVAGETPLFEGDMAAQGANYSATEGFTGGEDPSAPQFSGDLAASGDFYGGYMRAKHGMRGGSSMNTDQQWFGGDEFGMKVAKDYVNSLNSKVKDELVDDIVQALKEVVGDVSGANRQETIKNILAKIPHEKTNGKSFKADAEAQKQLCLAIAKAINGRYHFNVINTDVSAAGICQQVAEIIYSLSMGMQTEFLMVHADSKRILKNLHMLKNKLEESQRQIEEMLSKSKDGKSGKYVKKLSLNKTLLSEIGRQIQLLENVLHIAITPAEKELKHLLKSEKDLFGMIEQLREPHELGARDVSRAISEAMRGLGITADLAMVIDGALKKVGMTAAEFAETNEDSKKFREKINEKLLSGDIPADELHDFFHAVDLLTKYFYKSKDIEQKLRDMKSGAHMYGGAMHDDEEMSGSAEDNISLEEIEVEGGNTGCDTNYNTQGKLPKSKIDKRIQSSRRLRNTIFEAFQKQISTQYDSILKAVNVLADRIGKDVPISDQLDGLKKAFLHLRLLVEYRDTYLSLIGYFRDAQSRERRETFLSALRLINSYVDTILEMSMYSASAPYFKELKDSINRLIATVDTYYDKVSEQTGAIGGADGECPSLDDMDLSKQGGAKPLQGIKVDARTLRNAHQLNEALFKFDYHFTVAQMYDNLKHTSEELDSYAEGYEDRRADAIAQKINAVRKCALDQMELLAYAQKDPIMIIPQKNAKFAEKVIKNQRNAKENMWKTVEAIDEYMRAFTNGIAKNPGDVKDIKKAISDVTLIHDWYSEKAGKNLHMLIDSFNPDPNVRKILVSELKDNDSKDHYYKVLGNKGIQPNQLNLGDLQDPSLEPDQIAKDILKNMTMLKNIMNVFIEIGYKFGGDVLYKKTFMSPTQIYKNLCEYIVWSAFEIGNPEGESLSKIPGPFDAAEIIKIRKLIQDLSGKKVVTDEEFTRYKNIIAAKLGPLQVNLALLQTNVTLLQNQLGLSSGVIANLNNEVVALKNALNVTNASISNNLLTIQQSVQANAILINNIRQAYLNHLNDNDTDFQDLRNRLDAVEQQLNAAQALIAALGAPVTGGAPPAPPGLPGTIPGAPGLPRSNPKIQKDFEIRLRNINSNDLQLKELDDYLALCLKSLCAKVLTVAGLYDVMEHPEKKPVLNSVRMILGGDEYPEVKQGAVELYLRLPLLAEFYRDLFSWDNDTAPNNYLTMNELSSKPQYRITMLPEMEGPFGELIRIIFRKDKHNNLQNYPENDLKDIIREINKIYDAETSDNKVMSIIHKFVKEVNMRYGLVLKADADAYKRQSYTEKYAYTNYQNMGDRPTDKDYPILPGEEGSEYETRSPAPSDSYVDVGLEKKQAKQYQTHYHLMKAQRELLYRFRCKVDGLLRDGNYHEQDLRHKTFNEMIKTSAGELSRVSSSDERFNTVAKLVRGFGQHTEVDTYRYLVFHEGVINGLNTLSALHTLLDKFRRYVIGAYVNLDPNGEVGKRAAEYGVNKLELYFNKNAVGNPQLFDRLVPANAASNFKEIMDMLISLGNDTQQLVKFKLEQANNNKFRLAIDFSGIVDCINNQFQSVRYFLDTLRSNIKPEIMDRYERREYVGSFYWLYEQLQEKMIQGRPATRDESGTFYPEYLSLNQLSSYTESVLNASAAQSVAYLLPLLENVQGSHALNYMTDSLHDLLLNELSPRTPGSVRPDDFNVQPVPPAPGAQGPPANANSVQLPYMVDDGQWVQSQNLFQQFNQTIFWYLNSFFDESVNKMYVALVNNFVSGTFNNLVMHPNKCKDDSGALQAFTPAELRSGSILYKSLAYVMKYMFTARAKNTQDPLFLLDNITDVSVFMKEKYKAELPVFKQLFGRMIKHANLYKILASQNKNQDYLAALDQLIRGCHSFITMIDQVHRELGDNPQYMETEQDSLALYKQNNGKNPLVLVSQSWDMLNALPNTGYGSENMKLLYASRYVLNQPQQNLNKDHYKLIDEIISRYNLTGDAISKIDQGKYDNYSNNTFKIMRYLRSINLENTLIGNQGYVRNAIAISGPGPAAGLITNIGLRSIFVNCKKAAGPTEEICPVYELQNGVTTRNILEITEDAFQDKIVHNIIQGLDIDSSVPGNRIIDNIIDLNIVPINVHALMRDIPLANLYNYGYTYDRMIAELLFDGHQNVDAIIKTLCNPDALPEMKNKAPAGFSKEYLLKYIMNPYLNDPAITNLYLDQLSNGLNYIRLSRPKFISDQIYNKALLGSISRQAAAPESVAVSTGPINTQHNRSDNNLLYLEKNPNDEKDSLGDIAHRKVKAVPFGDARPGSPRALVQAERFDLVFVRNLMFIVNLYRTLQGKFKELYLHNTNMVQDDHGLLRDDLAEFERAQTLNEDQYGFAQGTYYNKRK